MNPLCWLLLLILLFFTIPLLRPLPAAFSSPALQDCLDVLPRMKDCSAATQRAALTDKLIVKAAQQLIEDHFFVR